MRYQGIGRRCYAACSETVAVKCELSLPFRPVLMVCELCVDLVVPPMPNGCQASRKSTH